MGNERVEVMERKASSPPGFRNKNALKAPNGDDLREGYQLVRTTCSIHAQWTASQKPGILARMDELLLNLDTFLPA